VDTLVPRPSNSALAERASSQSGDIAPGTHGTCRIELTSSELFCPRQSLVQLLKTPRRLVCIVAHGSLMSCVSNTQALLLVI
jgi:hypothetical protein